MSRRITAGLCILAAGIMACTLAGCSYSQTTPDGTTPSVIAVSGGEADSRAEFLASQESPSGYRKLYDEARDSGYTGSYMDFLKELGGASLDGSAGVNMALKSAVTVESIFSRYATSMGGRPGQTTQQVMSMGAGVVYSIDREAGDAYILTNFHVVYDAGSIGNESVPHISDEIDIGFYGSTETVEAEYVGGAINYDIAVLRVENSDLLKESEITAATFADSESVTVGESVYAIGNPEGEGISITSGVISVEAETLSILSADDTTMIELPVMRTDTPVNHGNSGGGLFNASGEAVGIVNARSEEDGVLAFGYAIPSNIACSVACSIIDSYEQAALDGKTPQRGATRATLGVTVQVTSSESVYDPVTCKTYIEASLGVVAVASGSVAAGMGVDVGDTLVSATLTAKDGTTYTKQLTSMNLLTALLFDVRLGDTLTLTVSRNGTQQKLEPYTFSSESPFTLFAAEVV